MPDEASLVDWIALHLLPGIGPILQRRALARFGDLVVLGDALANEIEHVLAGQIAPAQVQPRQTQLSRTGQAQRLVVGTGDPVERDQPINRRQIGAVRPRDDIAHPANSAEAAAAAPLKTGPGMTKNSRMSRLVPARITVISRPIGRSKTSTGSSKYMSLTMRI